MIALFPRDPNAVPTFLAQPDEVYAAVKDPCIFRAALVEGKDQPYLGKTVPGPYLLALSEVLDPLRDQIKETHRLLDLSYLTSPAYYTSAMRARVDSLRRAAVPDIDNQIESLRKERVRRLSVLGTQVVAPDLHMQTIEPGVLAIPPYLRQGDSLDSQDPYAERGCANACFRMAYSAIMGEVPSATLVATACKAVLGSHLITNTEYLNIFHTKAITDALGGSSVLTFHIPGADLSKINALATKAKGKWHNSKVISIVSMASEANSGLSEHISHQAVLLGADDEHIYLHDPSRVRGGPNRKLSKVAFSRLWTIALNEAMVLIAPQGRRAIVAS